MRWLLALALAGCPPDEGVRAELVLEFTAQETLDAADHIELTAYELADRPDPCEEVVAGSTAVLGTLSIVGGPVEAPVRQASALGLDGVSFGRRLFFASARLADDRELARGCTSVDVGSDGATVVLEMQRVACAGDGSLPCGPDAVCRDGRRCEDRTCRITAGPVKLSDLPFGSGVGAAQVLWVGDGVLVAFAGAVGARGGVAVAHLDPALEVLDTSIIEASPCSWPALVPVDGGALVVWGDCAAETAFIRAERLRLDGTATGDGDETALEFPLGPEPDTWNVPELVRAHPTSGGAIAVWQERSAADADPDSGPWQIRVAAIGDDAQMSGASAEPLPGEALLIETATAADDGVVVEYVDLATGECRIAPVTPEGALAGPEQTLVGALSSCATVTFAPVEGGYAFLGQEIRRIVRHPDGAQTDPLLVSPDEPLERSAFGAFVSQADRVFLGWEEHSVDLETSRLQVAVLGLDATPLSPAVPFPLPEGGGPYVGFSMVGDGAEALYAMWHEGAFGANRIGVVRIECTVDDG